jgi:mitochondrial chaperone BCS1
MLFKVPSDLKPFFEQLFEAFIPGYSIISKYLIHFGVDVAWIIELLLFPFTILGLKTLYERFWRFILVHCTASISLDSEDLLFQVILDFIHHAVGRKMSSAIVTTRLDGWDVFHRDDSYGINANGCLRFEPNEQATWLQHRGGWFRFERISRTFSKMTASTIHTVTIKKIGWDIGPIEELLEDARARSAEMKQSITLAMRPQIKEMCERGCFPWTRAIERPSRPLTTVIVISILKQELVEDIERFWHPDSRKYYAKRGIPYRRGYLFLGPPGTGKTSMAFAIAGAFDVPIYVITLREKDLTDTGLVRLTSSLPGRCLVLLEDLNVAGVERKSSDRDKENGVTPPGLLNAIDGVLSSEGRVMIATANRVDMLDAALIRPGRIDQKFEFTLATKEQSRGIFLQMYSEDPVRTNAGKDVDIESLAVQFMDEIPDQTFC